MSVWSCRIQSLAEVGQWASQILYSRAFWKSIAKARVAGSPERKDGKDKFEIQVIEADADESNVELRWAVPACWILCIRGFVKQLREREGKLKPQRRSKRLLSFRLASIKERKSPATSWQSPSELSRRTRRIRARRLLSRPNRSFKRKLIQRQINI